jgi:outer membrane lipoprotein
MKRTFMILTIAFLLSACAHAVSQELRQQTDKDVSEEMIFKNPEAYKGKTVILGGIIIGTRNSKKGTYVEVLQTPLDSRGRPKDTDYSYGRFIFFYEEYLDAALFSKGKAVTVGGKVVGKTTRPLDDIEYTYPLIYAREVHLFGPKKNIPVYFSIGVGAYTGF